MIKTSVKRPFLVFVGVIMVLVLGAVAFVKMKTDLLPSINMPYAAVITTYPGAARRGECDIFFCRELQHDYTGICRGDRYG